MSFFPDLFAGKPTLASRQREPSFWSTTARAETHRPIGDGERLAQRQAAGNFHKVSADLPYFRAMAWQVARMTPAATENATSSGIK